MGEEMALQFIRNAQRKEIDFVVVKNQKPWFAVECKTDDRQLSKQISYYAERTNIPRFFQVHLGSKDYEIKKHLPAYSLFTNSHNGLCKILLMRNLSKRFLFMKKLKAYLCWI